MPWDTDKRVRSRGSGNAGLLSEKGKGVASSRVYGMSVVTLQSDLGEWPPLGPCALFSTSALLSCFCYSRFLSLSLSPSSLSSMASESRETAEHFIYVTQVYFCGKYP